MQTQRQLQLAAALREHLARILREEIDDPLVGFVTLTDVEVSADLRHARVFFSVLADREDPQTVLRGLKRAAKFIRHRIAEEAGLRYTPTLQFAHDPTSERAQRVEALLRDIARERQDQEQQAAGSSEEA